MVKRNLHRKKTNEEFIAEAKKIHGDKYGYGRVAYKTNHDKVDLYCKDHEKYFPQTPKRHLLGQGCPDCGNFYKGREKFLRAAKSFKKGPEKFTEKDLAMIELFMKAL